MPKATQSKSAGKRKEVDEDDPDVVDDEVEEQPAIPKPKKSKKKAEEQDEEEPTATTKPKKAKKASEPEPEPEPEPDPEPEEEEEEEEEEEDEDTVYKRRMARMRRNKKAKLVGYRGLARSAGYIDRLSGDSGLTAGSDGISCLLSASDAKRLMRFVPATPSSTSFGLSEYSKRHELFKKGVPTTTARETQARCDAVLRNVMNQVVLRAAENGKKNITASMMASVLRPYASNMLFTAVVPPIGLIRHAQNQGILSSKEEDKKLKDSEKKDNDKIKKMAEEWTASEAARLEQRRQKSKSTAAAVSA